MAAPGDNMEEEMMNIIANAGEQDVDDGSQYLALENEQENVLQENTGEVYILNIYYMWNIVYISVYKRYLFIIFLYVALWIGDHNGEEQKCSRTEETTGGPVHNIGIQHRDRRTTWST